MDASAEPADVLRGRDVELEGYAWLPRMLDKARAELNGVETGYFFGCPIDHTCMARLGIGPALVRELVGRHEHDAEIMLALRRHGLPTAAEQWFDAPALEDALHADGAYLRVRAREALPRDPSSGGRLFAGEEQDANVSMILIEAPAGYREQPHQHQSDEVVAVQSGSATFHLGEIQSRTVTAGQVVRIPAAVMHWFENRTQEPLQAVAARTAVAGAAD